MLQYCIATTLQFCNVTVLILKQPVPVSDITTSSYLLPISLQWLTQDIKKLSKPQQQPTTTITSITTKTTTAWVASRSINWTFFDDN